MLHGFRSSTCSSWPGLSRPSTSFLLQRCQDVDARDKPGHDDHHNNPHALPRSSRNRSSFCCTGRSEKLNSTESSSASWVTHCQLGATNRSRGPHSNVCSPIRERPLPSIAANTVASVER